MIGIVYRTWVVGIVGLLSLAAGVQAEPTPAAPGAQAKAWIERGRQHARQLEDAGSRGELFAGLGATAHMADQTKLGDELTNLGRAHLLLADQFMAGMIHNVLAEVHAAKGEIDEAIVAAERAHEPTEQIMGLAYAAIVADARGDKAGWKKLTDHAMKLNAVHGNTDEAWHHWDLVDALGQGGDFQRAEAVMKQVTDLPHDVADMQARLATHAAEQGQTERAERYVAAAEKTLTTVPLDEETQEMIADPDFGMIDPREYAWASVVEARLALKQTDKALAAMKHLQHTDQQPLWLAMADVAAAMHTQENNPAGATALFAKVHEAIRKGDEFERSWAYWDYFQTVVESGAKVDLEKVMKEMDSDEQRAWACYGAAVGYANKHLDAKQAAEKAER